ncbi:MAG: GNAT family N-acetyltransferase, partial [Pirellulales bacterium]|nr:GNAT family N-acetyltransferase [Pirellulales bacterium]
GVAPEKLPTAAHWQTTIAEDLARSLDQRQFFYLIWLLDDVAVGHSNLNKIVFGDHAFMHLHLWHPAARLRGHGTALLHQSIERYFEQFQLQQLYCEPYSLNQAPNRTLPKSGFHLVKNYHTTPGWINFPQRVNRWELSRPRWQVLRQRLLSPT